MTLPCICQAVHSWHVWRMNYPPRVPSVYISLICMLGFIRIGNYSFLGIWWRHQMERFPRYWPFMRGIHRWPVNSLHKGQWRGAFMFCLICARTNSWANNGDAGDLIRHCAHYDVTVMREMLLIVFFLVSKQIQWPHLSIHACQINGNFFLLNIIPG